MSRHKHPQLNPRNWDVLLDTDEDAVPNVEKVRHKPHEGTEGSADDKPVRPRQTFHRTRLN